MINILIVEDATIEAAYLCRIVEQAGYHVIGIAKSANEAFNYVRQSSIDAVLTDVMIQGAKSGAEFAVELRQISTCAIIFTTAYSDEEMVEYAVRSSADGYLIKPLIAQEVLATLRLALERRRFSVRGNEPIVLVGGHQLYLDGTLYCGTKKLAVTAKMRELLEYLVAKRPDEYHSTHAISWALWDALIVLEHCEH